MSGGSLLPELALGEADEARRRRVWEQPSKAAPADSLWGRSLEDSGAGVRYSRFQASSEPLPCSGGEALWQRQQADPKDQSVLSAHCIALYLLEQTVALPWYHRAHT